MVKCTIKMVLYSSESSTMELPMDQAFMFGQTDHFIKDKSFKIKRKMKMDIFGPKNINILEGS